MPTRLAPTTRARDVDRSNTCSTLDAALAEGQMSAEEHQARVDLAMEAPTLADLHSLIQDLQGETDLAPMSVGSRRVTPKGKRSPAGCFLVVLPLIGAVVALVFGIRSCGSSASDDPVSAHGVAGYLDPAALSEIFADYRNTTGTSIVDRAVVYPEYVSFYAPADGAPQKQVSYDYRDGTLDAYDDDWSTSRTADTVQVDLSSIDLSRLGGIVAGAGQSLNVDPVETIYLAISADDGGTEISMHVDNADKETGYLNFDADGNILWTRPFVFGK